MQVQTEFGDLSFGARARFETVPIQDTRWTLGSMSVSPR